MLKDPVKLALWGMIVGNIENMGILPALQGGEAIADVIRSEGKDALEQLAQIDGENNYEIIERDGFLYVIIKVCPFSNFYNRVPDWGEKSVKLVESYNKKNDGGGALHPLCLVHKSIRNALKAGIISIACRSGTSGKVEIAFKALEKVTLTEDEVRHMIDGKGCLFAIKSNL